MQLVLDTDQIALVLRTARECSSLYELAHRLGVNGSTLERRWREKRAAGANIPQLKDVIGRGTFEDEETVPEHQLKMAELVSDEKPAYHVEDEREQYNAAVAEFRIPKEAKAKRLPTPPQLFRPWHGPPPHRLLIDSDVHHPVQDKRAEAAKLAFAAHFGVDAWLNLGDHYDCTGLSSYDKDPAYCRALQEEFDSSHDYWQTVCELSPIVEYILGNHEERMFRTVMANPAFFRLRALEDWNNLAGIPEKVLIHPYGTNRQIGLVWGEHGDQWKGANSTHWAMQHRQGEIEVAGHVHRPGMYMKTVRSSDGRKLPRECWTLGHGSDEDAAAPWAGTNPGWRHAFLYVEHVMLPSGTWRAIPHLIRIDEGTIVFAGKVIRG